MWQTALCGSLAGMLLLVVPTIAAAQDECGAAVSGKVDCGVLGPLYVAGGVTYFAPSTPPQDLTIRLGTTETQEVDTHLDYTPALQVINLGGAVDVGVINSQLWTTGSVSPALFVNSAGDLTIAAGSLQTNGDQSQGLLAISGGNTNIQVGRIWTTGAGSQGIYSINTGGDTYIFAGSIETEGTGSEGIVAGSTVGAVQVTAGEVTTHGLSSHGIVAQSTGSNTLGITVSGSVETTGDHAYGIYTHADNGHTAINANAVLTSGRGSAAIFAYGNAGDIDITAGRLSTAGYSTPAVYVDSATGNVNINVQSIAASGDSNFGVLMRAGPRRYEYDAGQIVGIIHDYRQSGQVSITLGDVDMTGKSSSAVQVAANGADVTLSGDVTATGEGSMGVYLSLSYGAGALHNNGQVTTDQTGLRIGGGASDITIDGTGSVTTFNIDGANTGSYSDGNGIEVFNNQHAVSITQNAVHTYGDVSAGVVASTSNYGGGVVTRPHDDNIIVNEVTTSGIDSVGIKAMNRTDDGTANVTVTGTLATSGYYSKALIAMSGATGHTNVNLNQVSTQGDYSTALNLYGGTITANIAGGVATSGNQSHAVYAYGGAVTINNAGSITTSGSTSHGMIAASTGAITITSNSVVATGQGSSGILAIGDTVTLNTGKTEAYYGNAIALSARTSADLHITGLTAGGYNGMSITAQTVSVAVAKDGFVGGGVNGMVVTAAGPAAGSSASNAPVSITIANAGTILGYSGNAIQVLQGVAKVTNSGTVEGSVVFAGGADSFENTGTFMASGASDFGAGKDVFHNTGVVSVGTGATTGQSASLANLELFSNDGTIDLHNGHTGDVLSVSGTFTGGTGSKLLMDIAPGVADQLVVGGTATGKTLITLEGPTARTSVLGNPVLLIKAGAGTDEDAFAVANPDIGMIHYGLKYVDGTGFGLVPEAGGPVWHALHLSEGAEGLWMQSADAWSAQMTSLRDLPGTGDLPQGQVWTQVYGQSTTHRGDGTTDFDIKSKQDASGVQFGAELVRREPTGDRFAFGLTGGYTEANSVFDASMEKGDTRSVNVGAYLSLRHGPYFFDTLASAAQQSFALSDPVNGFNDTFNSTTLGLKAEWGMHLGGGFLSYEPVVSLGYARAGCSNLQALGQTLQFDTTETLRGALGLRLSGQVHFSGGSSLVYHAKVAATHDFLGENGVKFYSSEFVQHIGDDDRESFGRVIDLGVSYQTAHGMTFDASAEGDYGKSVSSVGGRLGVRFRF